MDLSKLPKLGQNTQNTTPSPADEPHALPKSQHPVGGPPTAGPPPEPPGVAPHLGEAWLSISVGVILIIICPRLMQYLISPGTFEQKWSITDASGAPLAYPHSIYFWGDVVLMLFAIVIIIDGVLMLLQRRSVIKLAMAFTIVVAGANLVYLVAMLALGYGPQLYSLVAVALGGYIALGQFAMLKRAAH